MVSTTEPLGASQLRVLGETWRIRLDVKSASGTIGLREGRETGSSVEIQDFRDYVPGDDPRRIDWLAYGRTGRLVVRLFREEVSPFFDVLVDASASMALEDGRKHHLAVELCGWLFHSARAEGLAVRLFAVGEQVRRVDDPVQIAFTEPVSVLFADPRRAAAALRRSSVRLVLTDFMSPADPASVLRALSAGCSKLVLVHLLGPWEAAPNAEGPSVLEAAEGGLQMDIQLEHKAIEAYRKRLNALVNAIKDEMFRCGGQYVGVVADRGIEAVLRDTFLPAGLAEVRG